MAERMKEERRKDERRSTNSMFAVQWVDARGQKHSARARGGNVSKSGMSIETSEELSPGTLVSLESERHDFNGKATVRHSARHGSIFISGLEFSEETKHSMHFAVPDGIDYYEVLQVSQNAEPETIRRVYRIMAARFHPDNAQTGDAERFLLLNQVYEVLSDPEKRLRYDAARHGVGYQPLPAFELKEFVDGLEGEQNRRLGVLCLLYNRCRSDMKHPGLSVLDLERLMSFPREYLEFAIWYLKDKGLLVMGDNAECRMTAAGADYVELNSPRHAVLHKLLKA